MLLSLVGPDSTAPAAAADDDPPKPAGDPSNGHHEKIPNDEIPNEKVPSLQ